MKHYRIDNIEIVNNNEADKVIKELFQLPLSEYQFRLETSMKGSEFVFVVTIL